MINNLNNFVPMFPKDAHRKCRASLPIHKSKFGIEATSPVMQSSMQSPLKTSIAMDDLRKVPAPASSGLRQHIANSPRADAAHHVNLIDELIPAERCIQTSSSFTVHHFVAA